MTPRAFRETMAVHVHEERVANFEISLGNAIDWLEGDGFEITGISHAASVSYGESYDASVFSAVIWGQRESDGSDD